jgi:hypothetical protein
LHKLICALLIRKSALGHSRTLRPELAMSALPPKADTMSDDFDVR